MVLDIKRIVKGVRLKVTRDWIVAYGPGGNINGIRFHKNTVLVCGPDKNSKEIEVKELKNGITGSVYFAGKQLLAESAELVK